MGKHNKISIIGDQDTIEGFEIAGIVNDENSQTNSTVSRDDSSEVIANIFLEQTKRQDVAIILICDFASSKIQQQISRHKGNLPSVLVIPSKNKLY